MSKPAVSKRILSEALYICIAAGVIFAAWWGMSVAAGSEFIVPSIPSAFAAIGKVYADATFWQSFGGTLLRCVVGFAVASALFFVTFFLSTSFIGFRRVVEPIISALRSLPAVAVTLVLMLAVGGAVAPVVLGVIVIYPIMYAAAMSRTATVGKELLEICRLNGASRRKVFAAVYMPCLAGGLPEILSTAFSYNIKAVIGAEILAQTANSLGMLMKLAQVYLQPAMLVVFVITAVVASVIVELVMRVSLKAALGRFAE